LAFVAAAARLIAFTSMPVITDYLITDY